MFQRVFIAFRNTSFWLLPKTHDRVTLPISHKHAKRQLLHRKGQCVLERIVKNILLKIEDKVYGNFMDTIKAYF